MQDQHHDGMLERGLAWKEWTEKVGFQVESGGPARTQRDHQNWHQYRCYRRQGHCTLKREEDISHIKKGPEWTQTCRFGIPPLPNTAFVFFQPFFSLFHSLALFEVQSKCLSTEFLLAD
jgi:hypothetical protein